MSSFIHIKKKTVSRGDGVTELYAVPAVAISIGQGKKLIPNPAGSETCIFNTLEEAESAVKRAGFDYIFEGVKTYTTQSQYEAHLPQTPAGPSVTIEDSIPILVERLVDRETTVIANAAFALGELHAVQAIDPLLGLLGHEDSSIRKEVSEALAKMGFASIPHLLATFAKAQKSKDKNAPYVRLSIINAYLELTHNHREYLSQILPQVLEALSDDSWLVRARAALVIGHSAEFFREES